MACLASGVYVFSPSCDIDILSGSSGTSVEWMGLQSFINVDFLCKSIVMRPGVYVEIWECVQGNWQTFRIKVQVWNLYVESPYDLYSIINFCLFLHCTFNKLKINFNVYFFKWEIVREYLVHTAYYITSHLVSLVQWCILNVGNGEIILIIPWSWEEMLWRDTSVTKRFGVKGKSLAEGTLIKRTASA